MRQDDEREAPAEAGPSDFDGRQAKNRRQPSVPAEQNQHLAPLAVRQEQALALLCQGLRPPAIARIVGTSPATVRRWLRKRFDVLAREAREEHAAALLRAIESQREIARAAWEAYANEREVEAAILRGELDRVRRRATRRAGRTARGGQRDTRDSVDSDGGNALEPAGAAADENEGEEVVFEEYERPRHPGQGARYLSVALAAQREMARLQGLYDAIAAQPAEISITITRRPDGRENLPPGERPSSATESDEDERTDDPDDEARNQGEEMS